MQGIHQRISSVHRRQQQQWTWNCAAWGLLAGGCVGCVASVLLLIDVAGSSAWTWLGGSLVAGPALGFLVAWIFPCPLRGAAVEIDRKYALKDRTTTARTFLTRTERTPIQELQLADTDQHLAAVDPVAVVPFRIPRPLTVGMVLTAVALVLTLFAPGPQPAVAAVVNHVVLDQALRLDEELQKLEEFNEQDRDPEIDQLLKELAQKLEELKLPGIDPKEALAKLSEMQLALEAKQQQVEDPQREAQLQSIGEALSLADPLQAAGAAMSQKEFEKAARELEQADLPQLDRQTERALTEKLDKLREESGDGARRQIQEALGQISAGLSQGKKSKFDEGMQGLAGECRKQARRNKLSDLMRKQCKCLGECKSECEGECKNTGMSNKKGGTKWGLASSGNEPGDKTPALKSPHMLQIKGQESASGDLDVETMKSPEEKQEAQREYREKLKKYEQLSESVLDSEPIPLGHRQTIRRYFEMIRPQEGEVEAVQQRTE